jgi:hypothetical protein
VARAREQANRDPHQRFAAWLETITDEDPPRDLAVHAAVCAGCQQRIAAIDMLTAIDPALAGTPEWRSVPTSGWLQTTGRGAVVVGGVAALMAAGIGSWRLLQASDLLGPAVASPTQAVLGGTGGPEPTPSASPSPPPATVDPTTSEAPTQQPTAAPPVVVPQPTPPPVQPTAQPTVRATATPRPTQSPAPTQAPTPPPTAAPTPEPSPEPTPTPGKP